MLNTRNELQPEHGTRQTDAAEVKSKTKRCPNCGQKTVINDSSECQWCRFPLLAKTPHSPTQVRNWSSKLLIILAACIMIFVLAAYQGIWKYVGIIPLNAIHDAPLWVIVAAISIVSVLLVFASRYVRGGQFGSITKRRILEYLIIAVVYPATAVAVLLYFIHNFAEKTGSQFELSIVSATIGGLVMVSGFVGEGKTASARELINVGKWFLTASVFSALFALFVSFLYGSNNTDGSGCKIAYALALITLTIGTFSFAWALSLLLPILWRLGR